MQITNYTIGVRFKIDNRELRNLDRQMKNLERKFKGFGKRLEKIVTLNIQKFNVDQKKLNLSLGNALDKASNVLVFDISRFIVDDRAMQAALRRAARSLGGSFVGGGGGYSRGVLPASEWDRREAEKQRLWWERRNALREDEARREAARMGRTRGGNYSFSSNSSMAFGGGVAGAAARMYSPLLGLGLGGYGLAQTNRLNQEVISAQLTTQAVTEAAGLQGQGPAAFNWLRQQGNRIGFSYMDQAQDYNNFLSNSLGAGQSMQQTQDIYLGFAEYQRAMGITSARQKLVMNALSQMQGKGVLSMEEVRRQMAESLPG